MYNTLITNRITKAFNKIIIIVTLVVIIQSCKDEPYSEGIHWDYSISCQDGFLYKSLDNHRGTIPVLNSDGTRLRCGKKRY